MYESSDASGQSKSSPAPLLLDQEKLSGIPPNLQHRTPRKPMTPRRSPRQSIIRPIAPGHLCVLFLVFLLLFSATFTFATGAGRREPRVRPSGCQSGAGEEEDFPLPPPLSRSSGDAAAAGKEAILQVGDHGPSVPASHLCTTVILLTFTRRTRRRRSQQRLFGPDDLSPWRPNRFTKHKHRPKREALSRSAISSYAA